MKSARLLSSLAVAMLLGNVTVYAETGGPSKDTAQQLIKHHIAHVESKRLGKVSNLVIRNSIVESADSVVLLYTYDAGKQHRIGIDHLIKENSSWRFESGSSGPIHDNNDLVVLLPQHFANRKLYMAGYTKVSRVSYVVLNFKDHSTYSIPVNDGFFCSSVGKKERSDVVAVTAYDKDHREVHLNKIGNDMGWK